MENSNGGSSLFSRFDLRKEGEDSWQENGMEGGMEEEYAAAWGWRRDLLSK